MAFLGDDHVSIHIGLNLSKTSKAVRTLTLSHPVGGGDFFGLFADAARDGFWGDAGSAFDVLQILDAHFDHAAFARRSHFFGDELLAFRASFLLLDLLHIGACLQRRKFGGGGGGKLGKFIRYLIHNTYGSR